MSDISKLNGMTLSYCIDAWGKSLNNESSCVNIKIENGNPKIVDIYIFPEGDEFKNSFNEVRRLKSLHFNIGMSDAEGWFVIRSMDDESTRLLNVCITEYNWDLMDAPDESLTFLCEEKEIDAFNFLDEGNEINQVVSQEAKELFQEIFTIAFKNEVF